MKSNKTEQSEVEVLKSQLESEQRNNKILQEVASNRLARINQLEVELASYKVVLSEQSSEQNK
ncbi:hypothetical protein GBP40_09485 [Pediococcus acidilactici]|uniref:hypothetical protein n=1 Tax=Pediococcus acidilactici TaxID=1254 RepID=UPI0013225B08|nr:hypothetical protein [Pediococcus acidilactici]KAF0468839.1 hypothetical protein GBP06_09395 [Pediococcus acidilactici]KAF0539830.1 hypothetical protein GBP40_09485 [Pediococcus acidilactici]